MALRRISFRTRVHNQRHGLFAFILAGMGHGAWGMGQWASVVCIVPTRDFLTETGSKVTIFQVLNFVAFITSDIGYSPSSAGGMGHGHLLSARLLNRSR